MCKKKQRKKVNANELHESKQVNYDKPLAIKLLVKIDNDIDFLLYSIIRSYFF